MEKVEFKKNFEIGYREMEFTANKEKTIISIQNNYSVPSSTVTSTISHIKGTLFEEYRWGWVFTDLNEIQSDVNVEVMIKLDRFEIDIDDFDEESFVEHLIEEASEKIMESNYSTVLKKMAIV